MKERLSMDDIDMDNEAILLRVAAVAECKRNVFHRWWHWTIFSRHRWRFYLFYFVTKTITYLVLPTCYIVPVKGSSNKRWKRTPEQL